MSIRGFFPCFVFSHGWTRINTDAPAILPGTADVSANNQPQQSDWCWCTATIQVSFGTEGGSGTVVPDLSIEVDDVETALVRFEAAEVPIEYGPVSEPWGVRRFFVRDPFGRLINILQHE